MKLPKELQSNKRKSEDTRHFKNKKDFMDFHTTPEIFLYTYELEQEFEKLRIFGDERDLKFLKKCNETSKIMCIIVKDSSKAELETEDLRERFDPRKIDLTNYHIICANCLEATNKFLREFRSRHDENSIQVFKESFRDEDVEANERMRSTVKETIPFLKLGDHVKVKFLALNKRDKEFMWVEIIKKVDGNSYFGILLNEPFFDHNDSIRKGRPVEFLSSQIYDAQFVN